MDNAFIVWLLTLVLSCIGLELSSRLKSELFVVATILTVSIWFGTTVWFLLKLLNMI